jgi:predicted esterase
VEQRFATSQRRHARALLRGLAARAPEPTATNPTLLYGYGGFEVPLTTLVQRPASAAPGTDAAACYVVANIRGGGEFGPAGTRRPSVANKQKSYDDFAAVAEDLIARQASRSRQQLGIEGGSNGGLLVGAVMLQRPELFGAVVCQVPLLDMRRYHQLLAGASWMAEYGDPDKPEQWAFDLAATARTRTCRPATRTAAGAVHHLHARRPRAPGPRAQDGRRACSSRATDVLYYENIEGGPRRGRRQRPARRPAGAGVRVPVAAARRARAHPEGTCRPGAALTARGGSGRPLGASGRLGAASSGLYRPRAAAAGTRVDSRATTRGPRGTSSTGLSPRSSASMAEAGHLAELVGGVVHRAQRRQRVARGGHVVEADDRDVLGTRMPRRCIPCRRPSAIWSLAAKTAVKRWRGVQQPVHGDAGRFPRGTDPASHERRVAAAARRLGQRRRA